MQLANPTFEEEYPEEAQILAELCEERQKQKERGVKIKPIFLDSEADSLYPQPIRVSKKIGRNEPCPCGSGKKYKRCCIMKT